MAQSRFQWFAQMFAALGVIISLLLVAYEMKQARDLAEADLYIQRANMAAYHISLGFEHDSRDEFERMLEGKELDERTLDTLWNEVMLEMLSHSVTYKHWKLGLASDEEWEMSKGAAVNLIKLHEVMRQMWQEEILLDPEFRREIDTVLKIL